MSKRLLKGDVKAGQTVVADFTEGGIAFSVEETARVEEQPAVVEA